MPIRPVIGITATCTVCGPSWWADMDAVPHYPTLAAAKAALADWDWDSDVPVRCPDCAAAAACDEYGHDYGRWQDCQCAGAIPQHHHPDGCPQLRWCARCGDTEYAYLTEKNTADTGGADWRAA